MTMNLHITDVTQCYRALEEKEAIIYKLSGLTLDDIIDRLAKGFEFVPNNKPNQTFEEFAKELEKGVTE